MANENAPLRAYSYKNYTVNRLGKMWQAVDPKTGTILFSNGMENAVRRWIDDHPK